MSYLILLAIAGVLSCALILAAGLVSFTGHFVAYKAAGQWAGTLYPFRVPLPSRKALKWALRAADRDAASVAPWAILAALVACGLVAGLGNVPALFGL